MRYKYLLIFLISIFTFQTSHSQKTHCEQLYDSIVPIYERIPQDELIDIFETNLSICQAQNDTLYTSNFLQALSYLYYEKRDLEKLDYYYKKTLDFVESSPTLPLDHYATALNNSSFHELSKGNFVKANQLLLSAIEVQKKANNDPLELGRIYFNISTNYFTLGNFEVAIEYARKSIEKMKIKTSLDYQTNPNLMHYELANSFNFLGKILLETGRYEEALNYLEKSEVETKKFYAYSNKVNQQSNLSIKNLLYHAEIMLEKEDYTKAYKALMQCGELQKSNPFRAYARQELLGKYYSRIGDPSLSIKHFSEALTLANEYFKNNKDAPAIARIKKHIGHYYRSVDSSEVALEKYQEGLSYFEPFDTKDLLNNPTITQVKALEEAQEILHSKAIAADKLYRKNKDTYYLRVSANAYQSLIDLLDLMRLSYLSDGSKFFIAERAFSIYEEAISIFYSLYQNSHEEAYLDPLFSIMEKNKSTILFDKISQKFSTLRSGLPDTILNKENNLRTDISFYNKLLSQAKIDSNAIKIKELEDKLFELKESYSILDNEIKSQHPKYHELKNQNNEPLSIKNVQEKISKNELLIEIFEGSQDSYTLSLSHKDAFIVKSQIAELENGISVFFEWLSNKPYSDNPVNSSIDSISYGIYMKSLLPSIEKHPFYPNLIFIPDGFMSKIPIEPLRTDPAKEKFLIDTYSVSYFYSIKQFCSKDKSVKFQNQKLLGFAPNFDGASGDVRSCNSEQLGELPFAQEELNYLSNNFKGLFFESSKAKTTEFLSEIPKYSIIHLATHACLNDIDPLLSEIHFSDGSLTNYDIENLNIEPNLVVLSACNTGQGTIKKGEGMISLSRGFFEAGVKSLQSSLWAINDQSSFEIIRGMYHHLKKGHSKSEALRKSKLAYIEGADKFRKHPYFWAGIIPIGDSSPLYADKNKTKYFVSLTLVLIVLVLFYFLIKRKS